MASVYERHRITLDEYHRMVEAGVFDSEARVELIEGELIEMPPIDPAHASAVDEIAELFRSQLAGRARVRCQNPITLPDDSEPQPDLVLASPEPYRYRHRHPSADEILLLIEVAASSLATDPMKKIPLYARSGIAEVWLVNLVNDEIVVHREPVDAWYRSVQSYRRGASIAPLAFPDTSLAVADLLPPA